MKERVLSLSVLLKYFSVQHAHDQVEHQFKPLHNIRSLITFSHHKLKGGITQQI